ncbi:L,D-transpeptidase family protein [Novosphingobium kaempferiae]|uniref:L,D-transpeptidase family protein n=1 Tax=Novosphingobium kaempferiae TaxID=2896849 RepID=UPI001E53095E|nr:L,D-transpeptidase family protein [Novosphingobium kaempferiae]
MRGVLRFAPLLLLLGVTAAEAQEPLKLPDIDLIRVRKAARIMELWSADRLVHVIEHIQLGDEPVGPKRFEGDERTPEGRYVIDWANPNSAYHLSLHISYPNAADRAFAAGQGRSPGGMIMIHGQPNAWPAGRVPGDWTDGCIAVSDEEIEALWEAVPDGTPIEIEP